MMGFMLTSLKVVNMAVSFFTATKRLETVLRKEDIFSRRWPLAEDPVDATAGLAATGPDGVAEGAGAAAGVEAPIASSLVTRPSLPVPATVVAGMPFSAKILEAAGDACPVA